MADRIRELTAFARANSMNKSPERAIRALANAIDALADRDDAAHRTAQNALDSDRARGMS